MKPWSERLCIGRQGYVRLCEHEVITWAEVEAYIAQSWREPNNNPTGSIELRGCEIPDSDHKQRLGYNISGFHSATLHFLSAFTNARLNPTLSLKWRVHLERAAAPEMAVSRPPTTGEMQAMAQVLRLEGAASMLPAEGPSHLPELDCFSAPWNCGRLRGLMRRGAEQTTSQPSTRLPPEEFWSSEHAGVNGPCNSSHSASVPSSRLGLGLIITTWRGHRFFQEPGLDFAYRKSFSVSDEKTNIHSADGITLTPSHDWYHAMDRNSYSWEGGCGALESCQNQSCRNYYNLATVTKHFRPDISRTCECELESAEGEDQAEGYDIK